MVPYNYNNYHDSAGSQASQPQGHAHQAASYPNSNPTNNGFASADYSYGNASYGQKPSSSTQTLSNNANYVAAASALNSLSGRGHSHTGSSDTSEQARHEGQREYTTWRGANPASSVPLSGYHMSNRSQADNMPLPAQDSYAARGRAHYETSESHAQSTYSSAQGYSSDNGQSKPGSDRFCSTAYNPQPAQSHASQPHRYASPLHAVQAQRMQSPQVDQRNSQPVRHITSSTMPLAMTVDPSQVYDNRAELERKAAIETARQMARRTAEIARKAEEERLAAEMRAAQETRAQGKRAEEERLVAGRAAAEGAMMAQTSQAAEAQKAVPNAERREERRRTSDERDQSENAANALQRMALRGDDPSENDDEAAIRSMFLKMRELNQRNPAMLAKLWEEERSSHAASQSRRPQPAATALVPPSKQLTSTPVPACPALAEPKLKPFAAASSIPMQSNLAAVLDQPAPTRGHVSKSMGLSWPPNKKIHLAEAAVKWLQALPENAEKTVHVAEILRCLDENPSYTVLCESLEALSLRFDRAQFARALLRAVPEKKALPPSATPLQVPTQANVPGSTLRPNNLTSGGQNQQSQPAISAVNQVHNRARSRHGTVPYEIPSFSSLAEVARGMNEIDGEAAANSNTHMSRPHQQRYNSPHFHIYQPHPSPVRHKTPQQTPAPSIPPEQKPDAEPLPPPRPPADKEEAARKRNFSDLIDLTNNQDSEDDTPPRKLMQGGNGMPLSQVYKTTMLLDSTAEKSEIPSPAINQQQYQIRNVIPSVEPNTQRLMAPTAQMLPLSQLVMSTSQQHTPSAALSATETEPVQRAKSKELSEERKQMGRITGKMLVEPIMRDRVARKSQYDSRTIARDVLLATGRHPEMRGLNHHLSIMQKLLGDHGGSVDSSQGETKGGRSDLATIRWDLLDPGEPTTTAKRDASMKGPQNVQTNSFDEGANADTEEATGKQKSPPSQTLKPSRSGRKRKRKKIKPNTAEDVRQANGTAALFTGGPSRYSTIVWDSRRTPPTTTSIKDSSTANIVDNVKRTKPKEAASVSTASRLGTPMSAPTGYAAFRQVDANGNVVKKKGRPVGWRKSIHSREAHGVTPLPPGQAAKGSTAKQIARSLQEPHYQVYACQWRHCNAELHNLDNLKKHLIKMHGKMNSVEEYECLWQGCHDFAFEDLELWLGHVNKQHLEPIAWKLGDGPKGGMTVTRKDSSLVEAAYLSDASGRSVTPIILPGLEDDLSSIGPLLKAQEPDPAHELDELRRHKQIVGPVFERNGCRFANAKRRMGFLDDEDFEDIIEELPGEVEPLD
ncbi:hypothetical protein K431DRAFT_282476 [Polychaeton citri CBS 116435]|uniref:C2H2-type domain-containing protein n=1 Tax=Polychaeton citri CBS 116435 TaxID=1314669 RepID=A0A9P4QAU4_9PEZI|nr:hypothetical protein K431DRAFT_282476 [Polychaeton citri CBS 116435]